MLCNRNNDIKMLFAVGNMQLRGLLRRDNASETGG